MWKMEKEGGENHRDAMEKEDPNGSSDERLDKNVTAYQGNGVR